jgi:hypothetical protein
MSQYRRPGSNSVPIAVNDVVLITTPEGTFHPDGCGCGSCSGGGGGTTGAQGVHGSQGTQGLVGPQGLTGVQGSRGTQGLVGSGSQGIIGSQGIQGVQGGGVSIQDVQDAIQSLGIGTTDDLTEGVTNKYFTVSRVSYEHIQGTASNSWTITHNLGFKPNVTVIDSAGTIYEGEIAYINTSTLTISFSAAFSGKAFLS